MARRSQKPPSKTPELGTHLRILVLHGPERFLQRSYTDKLKEAIANAGESPETFAFDGLEHTPADVLDECRSFSLMGGYKVVTVDNAETFIAGENRPIVERYAEAPADNCTLVLRTNSWRKSKIDETIADVGGFIPCDTPTAPKAAGWAKQIAARRHDADMTDDAAIALVERVGCNLDELASAVSKLASSVLGESANNTRPTITDDDVTRLVGKTREEQVWDIQQFILRADADAALAHIADLLTVSREPPIRVRFALADLARKTHGLALAAEAGESIDATAKALRVWGPAARTLPNIAARIGAENAAQLVSLAVTTDFRAKSSDADEHRDLEVLSLQMIERVRRAR